MIDRQARASLAGTRTRLLGSEFRGSGIGPFSTAFGSPRRRPNSVLNILIGDDSTEVYRSSSDELGCQRFTSAASVKASVWSPIASIISLAAGPSARLATEDRPETAYLAERRP